MRFAFGCGLVISMGGCLILFRALFGQDLSQHIWADNFDANLVTWIFEWGYHALVETGRPLSFWHANSFYPYNYTLAFSESLLSGQLIYSPLRYFGVPPLAAIYVTFFAICLLGASMTDLALQRLKFGVWERLPIIFGAHFSLPMVTFFYHFQLFGFTLAPPFFLYLYLYCRDLKTKDLVTVCSLYCLGVMFSAYLAPMLLSLSVVLVAACFAKSWHRQGLMLLIRKIGWRQLLVATTFASLLFLIQLQPYLDLARQVHIDPTSSMSRGFSARLSSLWNGRSIYSFWYSPGGYDYGGWERAYFPGYLLLGFLTILLAVLGLKRWKKMPVFSEGAAASSLLMKWQAVLFASAFVFSLGGYNYGLKLPLYAFRYFIPGLESVRAPGRFGMFIALPLTMFAVALIVRFAKTLRLRRFMLAIFFLLLVVESLPSYQVFPFKTKHESTYQNLAQHLSEGTPLIELPLVNEDGYETLKTVMNQLKGSTIHWGRLVVGYGAAGTPEYNELLALDEGVDEDGGIESIIDFATRLNVNDLLIHISEYPPSKQRRWRQWLSTNPQFQIVFEQGGSTYLKKVSGL